MPVKPFLEVSTFRFKRLGLGLFFQPEVDLQISDLPLAAHAVSPDAALLRLTTLLTPTTAIDGLLQIHLTQAQGIEVRSSFPQEVEPCLGTQRFTQKSIDKHRTIPRHNRCS
jgi:hypothetical protein